MKKYIKETVTQDIQTIVATICDKCGEEIHPTLVYDAYKSDWFSCEFGNRAPRGGAGEVDSMDLCWKCRDTLFKLLKENGYKIHSERWDY